MLAACGAPTNFKCDPATGADCDGGTGAGGSSSNGGGSGNVGGGGAHVGGGVGNTGGGTGSTGGGASAGGGSGSTGGGSGSTGGGSGSTGGGSGGVGGGGTGGGASAGGGSGGTGGGSGGTGGGSSTGGGAGTGGGASGSTTQTVLCTLRRYSAAGQSTAAYDFAANVKPTLRVRTGSGFVDVTTGSQTATGRYVFTSVPAGQRYLTFDTVTIVDPGEPLDLSEAVGGRGDVAQSDGGTTLVLDTTGLRPWTFDSELQLAAPNAGFFGFHVETYSHPRPDAGYSPGPQLQLDYADGYRRWYGTPTAPLIDGAQGDTAYLTELISSDVTSSVPDGGISWYVASVAGGQLSTVTVKDHASTSASVALSTTISGGFFTAWARDTFWPGAQLINPNVQLRTSDETFGLSVVPFTSAEGFYSSTPDLVTLHIQGALFGSQLTTSLPYVSPYPSGWAKMVDAQSCYSMTPIVVGDAGLVLGGCIGARDLATTPEVRAVLLPPTDLAFDGQQRYYDASLTSLTPTITWTAATMVASGMGPTYRVLVYEVTGAGPTLGLAFNGSFLVADTSLVVPPGTFQSKHLYVVKVRAISQASALPTSEPFRHTFPTGWADSISGVLHAP